MTISFLFLFGSGLVAGTLAGLLGIGGGLILVPVLYFVLQSWGISAETAITAAVATSLATIVPTGISSAYSHFRSGYVNINIWRAWIPWVLGGALVGALIAANLSGEFIRTFFCIMTAILAVHMIYTALGHETRLPITKKWVKPCVALGVVFSSWIGIGGGVFNVPIMLSTGMSLRHAIGTAAAIGPILAFSASIGFMISSAPETISVLHSGFIIWPAFLLIVLGSVLTAPFGAFIAHRMPVRALKIVFALFLVIATVRVFLS